MRQEERNSYEGTPVPGTNFKIRDRVRCQNLGRATIIGFDEDDSEFILIETDNGSSHESSEHATGKFTGTDPKEGCGYWTSPEELIKLSPEPNIEDNTTENKEQSPNKVISSGPFIVDGNIREVRTQPIFGQKGIEEGIQIDLLREEESTKSSRSFTTTRINISNAGAKNLLSLLAKSYGYEIKRK